MVTNRRVDVVEEGFDLALRVSLPPLEDSQLVVRTLGMLEPLLVCSPWFIAQHSEPTSAADLARMPTLSVRHYGNRYTFAVVDDDGEEVTVSHTPRFVTDDLPLLRDAALEGLGIVMLPRSLVRSALADGSLVQVLPEVKQVNRIVHVVFPSRKGLIPAVRSLIDALVAGFSATDATQHGLRMDARSTSAPDPKTADLKNGPHPSRNVTRQTCVRVLGRTRTRQPGGLADRRRPRVHQRPV